MATKQELEAAIDRVEEAVTANTTVDGSASELLTRLNMLYKDALAQGGTSDEVVARLTALNDALTSSNDKLSEAVAINTPAE